MRVLCANCKEEYSLKPSDAPPDFPIDRGDKLCRPVGCRECRGTGFSGRTGLYELLVTGDAVRRLCVERADAGQIREYGIRHGMLTLRQCGWQKVLDGITSVEEVLRITKGDII